MVFLLRTGSLILEIMETTTREDVIYAIDQLLKLLDENSLWKVLDDIAKEIAINHIPIEAKSLNRKS
jgi:hypothetical protein